MLVESARISRGDVKELTADSWKDMDAVVIPGGFGAAKNFSTWAFDGPESNVNDTIKSFLISMVVNKKPIASLCVSPVVLAKAFEGVYETRLSLGTSEAPSPYDIKGFAKGIESIGSIHIETSNKGVVIDKEHKIVCAPCYMMDSKITDIRNNSKQAIEALANLF
jgi:enhancing lycopene biosynthesis protein 2